MHILELKLRNNLSTSICIDHLLSRSKTSAEKVSIDAINELSITTPFRSSIDTTTELSIEISFYHA